MFERFTSLYIDEIRHVVFSSPECFREVASSESRGRAKTLDRVESLHRSPNFPLRVSQGLPSTFQLSRQVLPVDVSMKEYGAVILAQSYPDTEPLAAPLQRLLDNAGIVTKRCVGLTHLHTLAAVESLTPMDWLLDDHETGLLLLCESLPFQHQRAGSYALPWGNGAASMTLSRTRGGLKVEGIYRAFPEASVFNDETSLAQAWVSVLSEVSRGLIDRCWIIADLLLSPHGENDYRREKLSNMHFQSCDPWLSLAYLCEERKIKPGERVLLATTDGRRTISVALLELVDRPNIHIQEIGLAEPGLREPISISPRLSS